MADTARKAKVLLVDDEPNILLAIEFLVLQQGYEVSTATNGEEALQVAAAFMPDIIVLDVMMPGMDGYEVARHIRANPSWDHIRIIFLTAKGATADRMQGYTSGGEVYITKPFDNDYLITTINEVHEFG